MEVGRHCTAKHSISVLSVAGSGVNNKISEAQLSVITIYKNKKWNSDCTNYRGITLPLIIGKIITRVLLSRIVPCWRQPSNVVFVLGTEPLTRLIRQIKIKCQKQKQGEVCHFCWLDQSIWHRRTGLWRILEKLDCPRSFSQCSSSSMRINSTRSKQRTTTTIPRSERNETRLSPCLYIVLSVFLHDHRIMQFRNEIVLHCHFDVIYVFKS